MEYAFECTYCGHCWEDKVYSSSLAKQYICARCGDKYLKVKSISESKIDYYQGAPPFANRDSQITKKPSDKDEYWGFD